MKCKNKKIGIWGFGVVGRSAVTFFKSYTNHLEIFDQRILTTHEQEWLIQHNIAYNPQKPLDHFLHDNDYILASPGIDISLIYQKYRNKWLNEPDLFYSHFNRSIISLTGSVGKTTITHILSDLLNQYGCQVKAGGNIGEPMLNLVAQEQHIDTAIIEVSSFQLEHCTQFAPNFAILTNFSENHLDRHGSIQQYFTTKCRLFLQQKPHHHALVPLELISKITSNFTIHSTLHGFSVNQPTQHQLNKCSTNQKLFFVNNGHIIMYHNNHYTQLVAISTLPEITFIENWLIIIATLTILGHPVNKIATKNLYISLPKYRLEKIATINHIDFYNDSKSTTSAATLAAIEKLRLRNKPIVLFLGGLSKGIDRKPLIKSLHNKVRTIYCFGSEADNLHELCKQYTIASAHFKTLDDAFYACLKNIEPHDQVLFSPAGSSFDLFENFQKRGEYFEQLVLQFKTLKANNSNS